MSKNARGGGRVLTACGLMLIALGVVLACSLMLMRSTALDVEAGDGESERYEPSGYEFPKVNWEKWKSVNPDVIAWISIPKTDVSYPVVQASDSDPEFYLHHDIRGSWNIYGTVFLDHGSKGGALASSNAAIYGHHMNDGSMFAALDSFNSAKFSKAHRVVLIQTPEHKAAFKVTSTRIINANSEDKATEFPTRNAFTRWRDEQHELSRIRLTAPSRDRVVSLITCSYHYWGNERTVVFAQPVWADGSKIAPGEEAAILGETDTQAREAAAILEREAKAVENAIADLKPASKVQTSDATAIMAAQGAYDALPDEGKKRVGNVKKLECALLKLQEAERAAGGEGDGARNDADGGS